MEKREQAKKRVAGTFGENGKNIEIENLDEFDISEMDEIKEGIEKL